MNQSGVLACLLLGWGLASAFGVTVRQIDPSAATGASKAVVVRDAALAHTAQLLPLDDAGRLIGPGDVKAQAAQVMKNISTALGKAQRGLRQVVKLNVYAADAHAVTAVQAVLAAEFEFLPVRPAVSFVTGKLPHPDALVAMDAIGIVAQAETNVRRHRAEGLAGPAGVSHVAVLPPGSKVYISGQAEKGTLTEATRKTLESLTKTLAHLKLGNDDIVQLKAFLNPMAEAGEVEKEMLAYFKGKPAPPIVFVEWKSNLPIEIELIAAGGKAEPANVMEFITPPDMKASPVYCRVVRVNKESTIYFSSLHAEASNNGKAEVTEIFGKLKGLLDRTGSDLLHLAKATYYVSDNDSSNELNAQRPNYYDPARPPAASKAMVPGVGKEGKTITVDMIAVEK